ncbi:proline iminopeptidase [Xylariomycetidae sp. FL0641]|nr:proline iminopeptidase [Xylariomycetidae sp. FL0641]
MAWGNIPWVPTQTKQVSFELPEGTFRTHCHIFGVLPNGKPPLIVAHGMRSVGKKDGHTYLMLFGTLYQHCGITVIFYDQVGCGASSMLPDWLYEPQYSHVRRQIHLQELDNLILHLNLVKSGFHLLGHSWGGTLAAAFAARQPYGLQKLVLASPLASEELAVKGTRLLIAELPEHHRKAIEQAEKSGQHTPALQEAFNYFQKKHVYPEDVFPRWSAYPLLTGPCHILERGKQPGKWNIIPIAGDITAQTLIYSGR